MDWKKFIIPLIVGGLAAVAELLADHKDFNFTGDGLMHLVEVFVGGVAAAFLVMFGKGAATPSPSSPPPSSPSKTQ